MTPVSLVSLLAVSALPLLAARAQSSGSTDHVLRPIVPAGVGGPAARANEYALTRAGLVPVSTDLLVAVPTDSPASAAANVIASTWPVRDSTAPNHRIVKSALVGGVIGAAAGVAIGVSLPAGCIATVEGGNPHCSTTKIHAGAAAMLGVVGGAGGALVGAALGKLSTWL